MSLNISLLSRAARFGNEPIPLRTLTRWALTGRIRLPEFQRPWLWGCGEAEALLESLFLGEDISGLVLLESEGFNVGFDSRPIEGAEPVNDSNEHTAFLLDGRQRLTVFTHALCVQHSPLPGFEKDFFIDLNMAAQGKEGCVSTEKQGRYPLRGLFERCDAPSSMRDIAINCMRVRLTRDLF